MGGLVVLSAGLTGFFSPATLAEQFGIPFETNDSSQKNKYSGKNGSAISSGREQDLTKAWIVSWAGREIFLGSLILMLLYLNETKALGLAMTLGNVVGASDTTAALKSGREGSFKKHLIPTVLLAWVGPLGMLLARGSE